VPPRSTACRGVCGGPLLSTPDWGAALAPGGLGWVGRGTASCPWIQTGRPPGLRVLVFLGLVMPGHSSALAVNCVTIYIVKVVGDALLRGV